MSWTLEASLFNNIRKVEYIVTSEWNVKDIRISYGDSPGLCDGGTQNVRVSKIDGWTHVIKEKWCCLLDENMTIHA